MWECLPLITTSVVIVWLVDSPRKITNKSVDYIALLWACIKKTSASTRAKKRDARAAEAAAAIAKKAEKAIKPKEKGVGQSPVWDTHIYRQFFE